MLLVFRGETALSDFRRLPSRTLPHAVADLDDLTAEYFFMAHLNRPLAETEQRQLRHILGAGPEAPTGQPNQLAVCPRPGTISPWSSKATDILHNCGFDAVERIRRGIAYTFHSAAQPTATQLTDVAPLLHDRMTEAPAQNVESLFERIEPQPLVHIPVLAEGRKALERANSDMGLAPGRGRSRLFSADLPERRARSDGRRAHDVLCRQLRALSPQNFQRRLENRRGYKAAHAL